LGDFFFIEEIRDRRELKERILEYILNMYAQREGEFGSEQMREIERIVLLTTLDELWRDHLYRLDHLKEETNLRAYGQKDPLVEYKKEAFALFDDMLTRLRDLTLERIFRVQIVPSMPQIFVPVPQREKPEGRRRRGVILED
jgi:preprotein translocase subunit SecA